MASMDNFDECSSGLPTFQTLKFEKKMQLTDECVAFKEI